MGKVAFFPEDKAVGAVIIIALLYSVAGAALPDRVYIRGFFFLTILLIFTIYGYFVFNVKKRKMK